MRQSGDYCTEESIHLTFAVLGLWDGSFWARDDVDALLSPRSSVWSLDSRKPAKNKSHYDKIATALDRQHILVYLRSVFTSSISRQSLAA